MLTIVLTMLLSYWPVDAAVAVDIATEKVDIDTWLTGHPGVAAAMVWQAPGGIVKPFPTWTAGEKSILIENVRTIAEGHSLGLPEAPPLLVRDGAGARPLIAEQARYAPDLVWRYYVAYLAQSLAIEIGGTLSWSLADYDAAQLAILLDSRSLFVWDESTGAYRIPFDLAAATPGDPVRTFQFLRANDLVGPTRRATIERLLDWVRANLIHFTGDWDAANVFDQWQYYGWPPVERMIAGTKLASNSTGDVRHRSGGCLGTAGFLHIVLRTVNIPAAVIVPCPGHSIVHFASEGVYLSHGDDPYNSAMHSTPKIPVAELFIDQETFNAWFGGSDGRLNLTICKNIGRRIRELMIEHVPLDLVASHCQDRSKFKTPAESSVYQPFRFNYSVDELKQLGLWARLEERVKSLGGCARIATGK
jgi:hypothetical protein